MRLILKACKAIEVTSGNRDDKLRDMKAKIEFFVSLSNVKFFVEIKKV